MKRTPLFVSNASQDADAMPSGPRQPRQDRPQSDSSRPRRGDPGRLRRRRGACPATSTFATSFRGTCRGWTRRSRTRFPERHPWLMTHPLNDALYRQQGSAGRSKPPGGRGCRSASTAGGGRTPRASPPTPAARSNTASPLRRADPRGADQPADRPLLRPAPAAARRPAGRRLLPRPPAPDRRGPGEPCWTSSSATSPGRSRPTPTPGGPLPAGLRDELARRLAGGRCPVRWRGGRTTWWTWSVVAASGHVRRRARSVAALGGRQLSRTRRVARPADSRKRFRRPTPRRAIAASQRRSVADRFTYEAGMRRVVGEIGRRMARTRTCRLHATACPCPARRRVGPAVPAEPGRTAGGRHSRARRCRYRNKTPMKLSYVIVTRNRREACCGRSPGWRRTRTCRGTRGRRSSSTTRPRTTRPTAVQRAVPRDPARLAAGERGHARPQPRRSPSRAGGTSPSSTTTATRPAGRSPTPLRYLGRRPKTAAARRPGRAARRHGRRPRRSRGDAGRGEHRPQGGAGPGRRVRAGVLPPGRGVRPELPPLGGGVPRRAVRGRRLPPRQGARRPAARPSTHRMDLRNNLILVERYLPPALRRAYRHDWMRAVRGPGHRTTARATR